MLSNIVPFLLKNTMTSLALAVGLHTTPDAIRSTWTERRLIARALLVLEVGVPLLALLVVTIVPMWPGAMALIALMAVCPGTPVILGRVRDRPLAVVVVALASALAPLLVPAWVAVLNRVIPLPLAIQPLGLMRVTFLKVLLPLVAGVIVAGLFPRAAEKLAHVFWVVFLATCALAVAFVLKVGAPFLLHANASAVVGVVLVSVGASALGHWAGMPRPADSRAFATFAVLGNPALALAVVAYTFPGFRAQAPLAAYLIVRALAFMPYALLTKTRRAPHGPSKGAHGYAG